MKQRIAPLMLVTMSSTFFLIFGMAAAIAGSIATACACLVVLLVTAALASFQFKVAPFSAAFAVSLPVAALAMFFAASTADFGVGLAWAAFLASVFAFGLLSAYFGRYRRRILEARRADA
ncbi:MAG: hypothetical protein ACK5O3_06115 [Burkholderiales bacterium]|jgi:hypothetical protein